MHRQACPSKQKAGRDDRGQHISANECRDSARQLEKSCDYSIEQTLFGKEITENHCDKGGNRIDYAAFVQDSYENAEENHEGADIQHSAHCPRHSRDEGGDEGSAFELLAGILVLVEWRGGRYFKLLRRKLVQKDTDEDGGKDVCRI